MGYWVDLVSMVFWAFCVCVVLLVSCFGRWGRCVWGVCGIGWVLVGGLGGFGVSGSDGLGVRVCGWVIDVDAWFVFCTLGSSVIDVGGFVACAKRELCSGRV